MGRNILLSVALALTAVSARATDVVWFDGQHPVSYEVAGKVDPVVKMALQMFEDDMLQVTGMRPVASRQATIRIV